MPFPEPGVGPHYAPSRQVRIEHIDLELDLDVDARTFAGVARILVQPVPGYSGDFSLDCDEVTVDEVTSEAAPITWRHEGGRIHIHAPECPRVVLVRWHGAEPRHGLYFVGPTPAHPDRPATAWTQCQDEDAHFVFPCHDHPRAKHTWRIRLSGPAGYTLLSNGAMVDAGEDGGRAWAEYVQDDPMPAYLMTAVCAPLQVVEDAWEGRPVRYLFPAGAEEAARRAMGRTPEMIAAFSERLGVAYPWPRYDQVVVHDFVFGGMENVACTTMTEILLVDEAAALEWDPEGLVAHELAHQWFGDLVTCLDWSQGWLNESWATFMEAVWMEHTRPADEALWYRFELLRAYVSEASERYARPIVDYRFREPIDVFDRHLYEKGACVLATLRASLGAEAFWSGVRTYLERMRHSSVHTRDFQRALEDATGRNLDRFFDQFVFHAGHPVLEVSLSHEDGLLLVSVEQTQEGDDAVEAYHLDLQIEVGDGDGWRRVVLPIRSRSRTFAVPSPERPRAVRVDPGLGLLAEVTLKGPREWWMALARDADPVIAARALASLVKDASPPALDAVAEALRDHESRFVRGEAARLLGTRGDAAAEAILIEALGAEPDPRVRRRVVDALSGRRTSATADALVAVIRGEPETPHLLGSALQALGHTRDARAVEILREHVDVRSWAEVVAGKALAGLAATCSAEVLPDLMAATAVDRPGRVRAAACTALGALGDKVPSVRDRAREILEEVLREGGFRTSLAAIAGLRTLGDERAIALLEQVRASAPDGRVKRMAYEAVAVLRKGRTTEAGLSALRRQVEELAEENRALRSRVDRMDRID